MNRDCVLVGSMSVQRHLGVESMTWYIVLI